MLSKETDRSLGGGGDDIVWQGAHADWNAGYFLDVSGCKDFFEQLNVPGSIAQDPEITRGYVFQHVRHIGFKNGML